MGSGGALRLIEAAQQGAPNAAEIFPREAAANRGLFYANGQARSAQALLDRLQLDATASMEVGGANSASGARLEYGRDGEAMSPAIAHALFAMALLPLLSSGRADEEARDPLQALAAYQRNASN